MSKANRKKIINWLGNILVVICLIFLVNNIYKADISWEKYFNIKFISINLILVVPFLIFNNYFAANIYRYVLEMLSGKKIDNLQIQKIYITSNIGKYLPGNVMHFVGRNLLATHYNIPQDKVVLSTILELVMIMVSCIVLIFLGGEYFIKYVIQMILDKTIYIYLLLIGIVLVGLISIWLIKTKKNYIYELRKQVKIKIICKAQIKQLLGTCIGPITYCMVIYSLVPDTTFEVMQITFVAYVVAWIIGFITPGAPGGIGIREFILGYFLENFLGLEVLMVSIVMHRVFTIIADLLSYVIYKLSEKNMYNKKGIKNG